MNTPRIGQEIKRRLERLHGERLRGIVLFGSAARGSAAEDSDIDVLVLLRGPVALGRDLETNIEALFPLSLELGQPISATPVDEKQYEAFECPLFLNAKKDGIRL